MSAQTTLRTSPGAGFAEDFSDEPYWWRAARPQHIDTGIGSDRYDVVVVGSGITGMRAALDLARGGASVLVVDRDAVGFGASRRNGGFIGRVLKKTYSELSQRYGESHARAIYSELGEAYRATFRFIADENIACHAVECGRFVAATSSAHQKALVDETRALHDAFGYDYTVITPATMHLAMGTRAYQGGVVVPQLGSLHPGKYHQALTDLALAAGVAIRSGVEVRQIERNRQGDRFTVTAEGLGALRADHVIIATNGYTTRKLRWHARRVVPFTGYMAATEELPAALIEELVPHNRTIIDTNTNIDFFRQAPDSSRLLLGGDTGCGVEGTEAVAERMRDILRRVFPQIADVRFSNVWSGLCAGTFDMMPHLGGQDGLWYGMGYNFAGVPMGTYFGGKLAEHVLDPSAAPSIFAQQSFGTMPFYNGNPWFVPMVMRFFDWQDKRLARRSA